MKRIGRQQLTEILCLLSLLLSPWSTAAPWDSNFTDKLKNTALICMTPSPKVRVFLRLRQDLRDIVQDTAKLLADGGTLMSSDLGQEFRAAMENENKPEWMQEIEQSGVVMSMADPGVREFVYFQFIEKLESRSAKLSTGNRIKLLQRLTSGDALRQRTGIRHAIFLKGDRGERPFQDPVWQFLAIRNEWSNFLDAVERYALERLADIDTADSWYAAAWTCTSGQAHEFRHIFQRHSESPHRFSSLRRVAEEMEEAIRSYGVDPSLSADDIFADPEYRTLIDELRESSAKWNRFLNFLSGLERIRPLIRTENK